MMLFLLLVQVAIAEPPSTVFVAEGTDMMAHGPAFIVPNARMDALLIKASSAAGLQARLLESADSLEKVTNELKWARELRDEDNAKITSLEVAVMTSDIKIVRLVRQRNTACVVAATMIAAAYVGLRWSR